MIYDTYSVCGSMLCVCVCVHIFFMYINTRKENVLELLNSSQTSAVTLLIT